MSENNILSIFQYGFQKGISTQCALQKFSELIYSTMDASDLALSIYIDFSKAFDTVPHNILLKKLEFYGIRNNLLNWFSSYLSNRTQRTIIEDHSSEPLFTRLGVPQGSVLGPILFLLFINDLPNISDILNTILFADDSTLTLIGKNFRQLCELANQELLKFNDWCLANRLSVNASKTFYMLFSRKRVLDSIPLVIKSGQTYDVINRVDNTKFLGVYFNDNMTFKAHISYLSKKLARVAALIYQVRDLLPDFVLKNVYYAHAQSLLYYCNLIWCNTNKTDLTAITLIQKRLIRLITRSDILAHTSPLFRRTKILNLENLRKLTLGLYCFKNKNNFDHLQARHNYPTRQRNQLRPIRHRTSQFEKSFVYQAPLLWNELNNTIPDLININMIKKFKRIYKKSLVSSQ